MVRVDQATVQRLDGRLELADAGLSEFEGIVGVPCGLAGALEVALGIGGIVAPGTSHLRRRGLSFPFLVFHFSHGNLQAMRAVRSH